jgi:DNA-binding response OmpR family regulator
MEKLIAVVDDEEDIRELVAVNLKKDGYAVKGFGDGEAFARSLKKYTPDLVILDLMLPGENGLEICKRLKGSPETASVPVIMLTAKADESDKIVGLELGADDYVTKPFSPKELAARVKAVLRRNEAKHSGGRLDAGGITLDEACREVTVKGAKIELTGTEFNILRLLISKKGQVLSRDAIMDAVWGEEKIIVDRAVDVHITHLRQKLGHAGRSIKNVRGVGYKLEA